MVDLDAERGWEMPKRKWLWSWTLKDKSECQGRTYEMWAGGWRAG